MPAEVPAVVAAAARPALASPPLGPPGSQGVGVPAPLARARNGAPKVPPTGAQVRSGDPGPSAVPGPSGLAGLSAPALTGPLLVAQTQAARLRTGPAPIASARTGPIVRALRGPGPREDVVMVLALKAAVLPALAPVAAGLASRGPVGLAWMVPVLRSPALKAAVPKAVLARGGQGTSARARSVLTAVAPWAKVAPGGAAPSRGPVPSPVAPMAPAGASAAPVPSVPASPRRKAVSVPRARKAVVLPVPVPAGGPMAVRPLAGPHLAARPQAAPLSRGQAERVSAAPSNRPGPIGPWWSMPPRASPKPLVPPLLTT